jgi:hypothetical protein
VPYNAEALGAFDEAALAGRILEVLATIERSAPGERAIPYHDLCAKLAVALGHRDGDFANSLYQRQNESLFADPRKAVAAVWLLVRRGLVYPHFVGENLRTIFLTDAGARVLDGAEPSPRNPLFIARFRERCANPNGHTAWDDVVGRIEDAAACLDYGLARASVVMSGLAFEVTIQAALDALRQRGTQGVPAAAGRPGAAPNLRALQGAVPLWPGSERHPLSAALAAAEVLRVRRNDAAHDAAKSFEEDEAEDLLKSAAHHIAVLWAIVQP